MTLEWILSEIKDLENAPNTAKSVYDLAALIIVRNELEKRPASDSPLDYRLGEIPTLDEIDAALAAIAVSTPEERQRVQDTRTLVHIMRGGD